MRDDHQRLLDILEAVAQIEKFTAAGRQRFERDVEAIVKALQN